MDRQRAEALSDAIVAPAGVAGPRLEVTGLEKRYGPVTAVAGVSLAIRPGEIVGLLGPNGAGKSTTIECILGLRHPDRGTIRVAGIDAVAHRSAVAQGIGVQLQATALTEAITVAEAVALFRSFYARGGEPAAILAETGLEALARRRFGTLSLGERQRLALALALVNDPGLLILDEPTASMDPHARRTMHGIIRRRAQAGAAILLATQIIDEAERLCDRVVVIDGGRVIAEGPPQALIDGSGLPTRVVLRTRDPWEAGPWQGTMDGDGRTAVFATAAPTRILATVIPALAAAGNDLVDCRIERPTLEDVFVATTGRRMSP